MKWQNLTERIRGSAILSILIFSLVSADAAGAQRKADPPFLLKKCWVAELPTSPQRLSASDNDKVVFFSESSGKVGALDLNSGSRIWQSEFGGEIVSNILTDETSVIFAANPASNPTIRSESTALRSISKQTGITVWSISIPFAEVAYLGTDGTYIFAAGVTGTVLALEKKDGSVKWQTRLDKKLAAAPYFSGRYIVLAAETGEVSLISTLNGERLFQVSPPSLPVTVFLADNNTLISGDKKGNITATDISTRSINWKFKNGAQVSSISAAGENILVASYDNFIYQMSPASGNVLWKRRLPGRVIEKPLVTKDLVVVRVLGEASATFIDLKTGKILGKILSESEDDITTALLTGSNTIILGKTGGIYSYSLNNCESK